MCFLCLSCCLLITPSTGGLPFISIWSPVIRRGQLWHMEEMASTKMPQYIDTVRNMVWSALGKRPGNLQVVLVKIPWPSARLLVSIELSDIVKEKRGQWVWSSMTSMTVQARYPYLVALPIPRSTLDYYVYYGHSTQLLLPVWLSTINTAVFTPALNFPNKAT